MLKRVIIPIDCIIFVLAEKWFDVDNYTRPVKYSQIFPTLDNSLVNILRKKKRKTALP